MYIKTGKPHYYPLVLIVLIITAALSSCLSAPPKEQPAPAAAAQPSPAPTPAPAAAAAPVKQEEPKQSIQQLILEGKSAQAKEMFQIKIDINEVDADGNTPLHAAAKIDNAELVSFLVYRGASTELKNKAGDTPLHTAIKNNCRLSAQILAAVGSSIFAKDAAGKTAVELGIAKGPEYFDILVTSKTGELIDETGRSIVHYLVQSENSAAVEFCIQRRLPLSVIDNAGKTPLDLAYQNGGSLKSIKIAAALIMANATPVRGNFSFFEDAVKIRNPSMRFDDGQTPLHLASIMKQRGITEYLLERGASTKAKDILGSTPLHEAVRYGDKEIVRILLKAGADPNSQDSLGKTPLLLISPAETRSEIYDLLLSAGANPNAKDMYGDTPLHIAVMAGMGVDVLKKLKDSGSDINERNKQGITPLALAVDRKWKEHVSFFSGGGADIHAEDIKGNTPLTRIFSSDSTKTDIEILQTLVDQRNVSSRDSYGNTPLHIAVTNNASAEQVKYLLQFSADVDARNKNGDSPLYLAVQKNRRVIGELLLAKRADVFSSNTENYSPLRLAMTTGGEVQEWILTSEVIKASDGIGNTPLHYASEWKLDNSLALLLEKGANPNVQNANGETAIFSAVKSDSVSTIELLVKKGSNKDARDYLGNTPLHACVRWDAKNASKVLLMNGAAINAQNLAGKTPLAEAARQGRPAMATILLDSNADINAFDATGKTVLMDAIQSGNIDIVSMLLKRGASPLMQEMYGRNAYHEAAATGSVELINLVRDAGANPLARDLHNITPFSLVLSRPTDVIKAVLGSDARLIDSDGNTPIHIAVSHKVSPEKLAFLAALKYPVNARNREGMTALSITVKQALHEQSRVLLENGADPYILDNSGECAVSLALKNDTPVLNHIVKIAGTKVDMAGDSILHYAARAADETMVKKLLSMGLDRTVRNISGETARDIALRWQRPAIAELLK